MKSCLGLASQTSIPNPKEFTQGTGEREVGGAGCQSEDIYLAAQLANQKIVGAERTRVRDTTLAPSILAAIIQ